MNDHFLIIGSQGSGNALLRGMLNAHSRLTVLYQWLGERPDTRVYLQWDAWLAAAKEAGWQGLIWGNDIVFQPMLSHSRGGSIAKQIIPYIPRFKIVWTFRRMGQLKKKHTRSHAQQDRALWEYWQAKDAYPHRVIMVSFEDVLFRPVSEMSRVCDFIGVKFEDGMFEGLKDTGNPCFNYGELLLEKL